MIRRIKEERSESFYVVYIYTYIKIITYRPRVWNKKGNTYIFSANLLYSTVKHLENSFSLRDKYLHCARLENPYFSSRNEKKKKKKKKNT